MFNGNAHAILLRVLRIIWTFNNSSWSEIDSSVVTDSNSSSWSEIDSSVVTDSNSSSWTVYGTV